MEAYTTEQINVIILAAAYLLVVGGLIWRSSKPKK